LSRSAAMWRRCGVFWCDAVRPDATWRLCVEVSFCAMQTVRVPGWCAPCVLVRALLEGPLWSPSFTLFSVLMNDQGAVSSGICCSFETTLLFNCAHYRLVTTIRFVTNLVKCSCPDARANGSKVHHRAHRPHHGTTSWAISSEL
jgi:hypothetical protein